MEISEKMSGKKAGNEKERVVIGSVKVGSKGQIVIPKNVREYLNINKGDSLFFIVHGEAIKFVKTETAKEFIKKVLEEFSGSGRHA